MEPEGGSTLVRMAQRDVQTLKLRMQRTEAPRVFKRVRSALQGAVERVQRLGSSPCGSVCFSTIAAPLLTDQLPRQLPKKSHPSLLRSDFVLQGKAVREAAVSRMTPTRSSCSRTPSSAVVRAEEHEDDLDDEEDEDDVDVDEDDDVSLLSWHMLSSGSPVRAPPEPVSDQDEKLQFDTIAAGNVPTLFVGRAYTNGAVNVMALHKMQKLLEDMYYHLICPHRDEGARSTVDLLLRLCWMPHPSPQHTGAHVYADSSAALLDRGLDVTAEDLALKSIADTHAAHASHATPTDDPNPLEDRDKDAQNDRERETQSRVSEANRNSVAETPRIAALTAQLPSEGLQTLFDCCSRISSILLSLSSAVQHTPTSSNTSKSSPPDVANSAPHEDTHDTHATRESSASRRQQPPGTTDSSQDVSHEQPSALPLPADNSTSSTDRDSSMHDAADVAAAGAAKRGAGEMLPPHGRNANMKKMAEQFLKDQDADATIPQQGGEESGDQDRWGPLWRPRRHSSKHPPEPSNPEKQHPKDAPRFPPSKRDQQDPHTDSTQSEATNTFEGGSQPHSSLEGQQLEAAESAAAATAAVVSTGVDREDEEKTAATVATAVAAAEALSQRVREAAARMSDVIDQMSRLLLPTPIPLGLAVLFSQTLPAYVRFSAASADQTALSNFCASAPGRRFRKHFDSNIKAHDAQRAARRCRFSDTHPDDPHHTTSTHPLESSCGDSHSSSVHSTTAQIQSQDSATKSCGTTPYGERSKRNQSRIARGERGADEQQGNQGSEKASPDGANSTKIASDGSSSSQLLAGGDSEFQQLPVFFVPGVKLLLPVQGHAVQFWPVFLSRMHLMAWINRAHDAMSLAWLAQRRAARQRGTRAVQARVARFFMWCRTNRSPGVGAEGSAPGGGLGGAGDGSGLDDDLPESSDEPSEVKDLMNELQAGDGGPGGEPGKPTLVVSIGPSGFGKSVELIALGMVSVVAGAADNAAGAVDSAVVALWGMRSLLGLRPKFSVQACSLGEAERAARAWNDESAPAVWDTMHGRWDMLQREVDEIMAVLAKALHDESSDASNTSTTIQLTVTPGHVSASRGPFMRRLLQHFTRRNSISSSNPADTATAGATAGATASVRDGSPVEKVGQEEDVVPSDADRTVTNHGAPQQQEQCNLSSEEHSIEAASASQGDRQTDKEEGAHVKGQVNASAELAKDAQHGGKSAGAMEWTGGTEGSRSFWHRRGTRATQRAHTEAEERNDVLPVGKDKNGGVSECSVSESSDRGNQMGAKDAEVKATDDNACRACINPDAADSSERGRSLEEGEVSGRGSRKTNGPQQQHDATESIRNSLPKTAAHALEDGKPGSEASPEEEDSILPRGVSENIRNVLKRLVGGPDARRSLQPAEELDSTASRWARGGGGSGGDGGSPDTEQMSSLRTGAEAGVGQSQFYEERATALAAAGAAESAPPLRDRLADFLSLAVAERRALVENMLAAQRSVDRGDVSPATLRELRRAERDSRIQLMHSLLAMGRELAAATGERDAAALRTTWITSVNSLLAIDQASGLSPLLPLSAGSQQHVQQLRTAPATLNFLLSTACSLHSAARRSPQTLSLLLEPAATLFDIHRSQTLHHLMQQQDAAIALSSHSGGGGNIYRTQHSTHSTHPRYRVHSSRDLVPDQSITQSPSQGNSTDTRSESNRRGRVNQHNDDSAHNIPEASSSSSSKSKEGDQSSQSSQNSVKNDTLFEMHEGDASAGRKMTVGGSRGGPAQMRGMHSEGRRWRFVLDALMPLVSQLDSHNSVALELDMDQLLGLTPPEMVVPRLATVAAAPPFNTPEFRGLIVVGDVSMAATKPQSSRDSGMPTPGITPEINFGYLPAASAVETERESAVSTRAASKPSRKPPLQKLGVRK